MKPNDFEMERVGNAIVTLLELDYTPEQLDCLNPFLKGHGLDLNDMKMNEIFKNELRAMDAIRILHDFAFQFQNEEDFFEEFSTELDNVFISINFRDKQGSISI